MTDIIFTQTEADALIAMEKHRLDDTRWDFPRPGESINIPLVSVDKREEFALDITRGRIDFLKGTFQNRSRKVFVLVRLDFGGRPHRNPDDEEIPSPHLHIYRQGYGDKWAMPLPVERFHNITDIWQLLEDFMKFCNITEPPFIDKGLFL